MTTLSTHDTKRSEDVRARILAVAGDPQAWEECSAISREQAREFGVDLPTAHLLWQTILGVGRISDERMAQYLLKALREAKQHTAWVDGDPEYEKRVLAFAEHVLRDGRLHDAIDRALNTEKDAVAATVLVAKVVALTAPGVPDTYQGCEIVNLSLVDPDNRRAVDYKRLEDLLFHLDEGRGLTGTLPGGCSTLDALKLLFTSSLLRLRRAEPELFGADVDYEPLEASSEHALGFVRSFSGNRIAGALGLNRPKQLAVLVTRAPARLRAAGGWGQATVTLPQGQWRDVVTGGIVEGGVAACATLLSTHAAAVLVQR